MRQTYTQLGNQEALVSLLKGAGYDVNYTSEVSEQEWVNYPLIIVDSYGWNGIVTDATFMTQYVAGFTAKPVQSDRGYFPLYDLSIAVNKAFEMEQSELKSCSNKLLQENEYMCEKILRVVSSRC